MKKDFLEPELEIIYFSIADVITDSNLDEDELPGIIMPQ